MEKTLPMGRKALAIVSAMAAHLCVASGQDLFWTFQWNAPSYCLLFEDAGFASYCGLNTEASPFLCYSAISTTGEFIRV